jgi:uncharacterized protein YmfQ (DUF2313 family)
MFFRIFQHLLPNARAWRLTVDKKLRQFFEGLTFLGSDIKEYVDLIWSDIFPQTTRELNAWEKQFGLPATTLTIQERRDRLDATWKALGGQSPYYIQTSLQNAGFNVFVHEWWELSYIVECGEPLAECGEPLVECGNTNLAMPTGTPTARDPFDVLTDGTIAFGYYLNSGGSVAISGGVQAISGAATGVSGGLLVNKPVNVAYEIPTDEDQWRYILYFGGQAYGQKAIIDLARKDEFEALCLKLCPAQQWIGLIVEFS